MSQIRLGVVMDPIASITPAKDSTLAMLLAAQAHDWALYYFEQKDLRLTNGEAIGAGQRVHVRDDAASWFELEPPEDLRLASLDVILMRKDPPFDTEYIYTTYILERAQEHGALVVNEPAALRDINEKAFTAWFPQCCPDTLITRSIGQMRSFLKDHGEIVVKPLHGMGGRSIFVVRRGDNNANVIFETLTEEGSAFALAQRFIPEITAGDKRILIVDGEPAGVSLARIPPPDDNRGNLVMGAQPEVRELSPRDRWICDEVAPVLRERGVIFAGLDVIGDYLTEINVTSPTGIREIAKLGDENLAERLMDALERRLAEQV
ncbi:MAG: glutathione synthase [Chromatiales bacterium]|nr:MAG: glutathione synthase [Chromatiales bacterium]